MGAHALPVITSHRGARHRRDLRPARDRPDVVVEQARSVLEDITIAGWKVGFLGSAEASARWPRSCPTTPTCRWCQLPAQPGWMDDDQLQPYLDAFRELILPATEVLVGNHKTLTDFLLPDWDSERPPSARELAVAAGEHGTAMCWSPA
jgi:hydroxymethylpyrimidine/phosphomethylpyrimidine kinase